MSHFRFIFFLQKSHIQKRSQQSMKWLLRNCLDKILGDWAHLHCPAGKSFNRPVF